MVCIFSCNSETATFLVHFYMSLKCGGIISLVTNLCPEGGSLLELRDYRYLSCIKVQLLYSLTSVTYGREERLKCVGRHASSALLACVPATEMAAQRCPGAHAVGGTAMTLTRLQLDHVRVSPVERHAHEPALAGTETSF